MREESIALQGPRESESRMKEHEGKISEMSSMAKAMLDVLDVLCDIVLPLGEELEIQYSSAALDSFFEIPMAGRSFVDSLADDSHESFTKSLKQAAISSVPQRILATLKRNSGKCQCHLDIMRTGCAEPYWIACVRLQERIGGPCDPVFDIPISALVAGCFASGLELGQRESELSFALSEQTWGGTVEVATQTCDNLPAPVSIGSRATQTVPSFIDDNFRCARCASRPPLLPRARGKSVAQSSHGVSTSSRSSSAKSSDGRRGHRLVKYALLEPQDYPTLALRGLQERWLMHYSDIERPSDSVPGTGRMRNLILARVHGTQVVVRVATASSNSTTLDDLPSVANELKTLRYVSHPNIANFHGAFILPTCLQIALVFEKVNGVRLHMYLQNYPVSSIGSRSQINVGICRALRYLHAQRPHILHGNLKPSTVLVESCADGPVAKLVDVGVKRLLQRLSHNRSSQWTAPEILQGGGATPSADVFSFGRVVSVVITGHDPCHQLSRDAEMALSLLATKAQGILQPKAASAWWALVHRCTSEDHVQRPDMVNVHEILEELAAIAPFPNTTFSL